MALKSGLRTTQSQRISLTPAMRMSLSMLRMPSQDVLDQIQAEAESNPLLIVTDSPGSGAANRGISAYDAAVETVAGNVSLGESLRSQLSLMNLPKDVHAIADYMTGDVADTGYLESRLEEISAILEAPAPTVQKALDALQACEPAGVGARSLPECLLLQLIDRGVDSGLAEKAVDHLELLVEARWAKASKAMGTTQQDAKSLTSLIRSLSPHPAQDFEPHVQHLVPDFLVEPNGRGGLEITLSNTRLPQLSIDTSILAKTRNDKEASHYSEKKMLEAQQLIRAIAFRNATMLRVASAIVTHQHRFFLDGPDHLASLTRKQIASKLKLHATTVGRAINGKSLGASGIVYPLDFFFSPALIQGGSNTTSTYAVQRKIQRLVDQESASAILSDDEISVELKSDGVDIARRTVAKYRGCMKIPSSFVRRRLKATNLSRPKSPGRGASV